MNTIAKVFAAVAAVAALTGAPAAHADNYSCGDQCRWECASYDNPNCWPWPGAFYCPPARRARRHHRHVLGRHTIICETGANNPAVGYNLTPRRQRSPTGWRRVADREPAG
jgi:hypothetical protein